MAKFKLGETYTRPEIHQQCGGGLRDYLPHVDGRVVCACVTLELNPAAPAVLLVGTGEDIERYGQVLAQQSEPIPVFIKQDANAWQFWGYHRATGSSKDAQEIALWEERAERDDLKLIIFMEKVRQEPS